MAAGVRRDRGLNSPLESMDSPTGAGMAKAEAGQMMSIELQVCMVDAKASGMTTVDVS